MPFARPTLGDLVIRIRDDARTRLELVADNASAVLRRSLVGIFATVWAGAVHMLHGHLDWNSRQVFADTAEFDSLIRMGAPYGISPNPPTFASGVTTATGTNGSPIPMGALLRRADGAEFEVTVGTTIASGTAAVSVDALVAGEAGNCDSGTILTFESPIAGVASDTTVTSDGLAGGADPESVDDFRTRYIARLREPPQGGADHDYVAWAKEVAGVTRVWVYENENGLGTVVVRFMRDHDSPAIPTTPEVAAVQAVLDAERPITAEVTAVAPVAHPIAFTLHLVPDTSDTRAAVVAELTDLLERLAEPGDGAGRGTILLSAIRTAIGTAGGITDYTMTVPSADVVPALGEITTLGTITYV